MPAVTPERAGSKVDTPTTIHRVAFTCDLARFSLGPQGYRHAQTGNMRWLLAVLGGLLDWPRMGVQVRCVAPAEDFETLRRQVRSSAVLKEYEDDAPGAWARRFDSTDFDVRTSLADDLLDSDLVVGFELPRGVRRMLHARGRAYISFHVHPLRFLRDLCLGAATNCPLLAAHLSRTTVPDSEVRMQVRRHTALLAKRLWPALVVPTDWPLLIGQTAQDAVLIEGGRFIDWPDRDDALFDALRDVDGCVLLEHPYRPDSADIARHVRGITGKPVLMTNANAYGVLFGNLGCPRAVTMASSLGVEASAIGIPTTFLLGDPRQRQLLPGVDVGTSAALHHGVLAPAFWKALFAAPASLPRARSAPPPFALGDDFLRASLDSWAYGALALGLPDARARKVLFDAEGTSDAAAAALCSRLAGTPEPPQGWCRIAGAAPDDLGVELVHAPGPLAAGARCQLEAGDPWSPLRLTGFHRRESWGAWSAQHDVTIEVALADSAVQSRANVELEMNLSVFDDLRARSPVLTVSRHGSTLAQVSFGLGDPSLQAVTVTTIADGPWCGLDLHLSEMASPRQTSGSTDARLLGIGLHSVGVTVRALGRPAKVTVPPRRTRRPQSSPDTAKKPRMSNDETRAAKSHVKPQR